MQSNSQHFVVSCLLTQSKLRLKIVLFGLQLQYNIVLCIVHEIKSLIDLTKQKCKIVLPFNMI